MLVITLVGNVGADSELRYSQAGKPYLNFRVASSDKGKDGEVTTWVNVSLFGNIAEKLAPYIKKGKQVFVSGPGQNRPYEKDGQTRYSLDVKANDIKLLGGKSDTYEATTTATAAPTEAYVSSSTEPF